LLFGCGGTETQFGTEVFIDCWLRELETKSCQS